MHFDISTTVVPTQERFAYWNDVVCKHCIPAHSRTLSDDDFDARLSVRTVGALSITEMSSPTHHWDRQPGHLRSGPDDDFWLSVMDDGEGVLSQAGHQVVQRPGDIVLYDAARPFTFTLTPRSAFIMRIPRRLLLNRVPGAEALAGTHLGQGLGITGVLSSMIREANRTSLPDSMPSTQARLSNAILDLLTATIEMQSCDSRQRTSHSALFERAKVYIRDHLEETTLDMQALAKSQNVSTRTLTRVFAAAHTTPMGWLWKQRLEASRCALLDGSARNVTEAALNHGFSDMSHFSRAFKKAFAVSPQMLVRRHSR